MKKRHMLFLILALVLAIGVFASAQASVTTAESGPAVGKHTERHYVLRTGTKVITDADTGEQVTTNGLAGLPFLYPGDTLEFRREDREEVAYVFTDSQGNFTTASKPGEDGKLHVEVVSTGSTPSASIITKVRIVGDELVQLNDGQFTSFPDGTSLFVLKYRYVPMWCNITVENWFEKNADHHELTAAEMATAAYYTNEQSSNRAWAEDSLTNGYGATGKEVLLTLRRPYIEGLFYSGINFNSGRGKTNPISNEYRIYEGNGWHGNYWEGWMDNQAEVHTSLTKQNGGYRDYSGSGSYDDVLLVRFKYTYGRTVTFDACGGTIDGYPSRIYEAEGRQYFNDDLKNGRVDEAFRNGTAYVPVRDGYYFMGWYEDANYKTPVTSIKDTVSKYEEGSEDAAKRICRLYAKWEKPASLKDCKLATIADQAWTGKNIEPKLTLTYQGTTLEKDKDYTVAFKNNKNIGKAAVTITGKGRFSGTKKAEFNIVPKAVKLSSLKAGSQSLTVKWQAGKGIDGYEIQYSLKKNFSGAKTETVKGAKKTSTTLKNLKEKTTYYVRVRAFKKVKGKTYYSEWSKAKSGKTK